MGPFPCRIRAANAAAGALLLVAAVACSGEVGPLAPGGGARGSPPVASGEAFSLVLDPSPLSIRADQRDTVRIHVTRTPPFAGPVWLEVTEATQGINAVVAPVRVEGSSALLLVETAADAPLGDAGLTVVGRGDGVPDQSVRLVLTSFGAPLPGLPPTVGASPES